LSLRIDGEHFDLHTITLLYNIFHCHHAMMSELGNVHQAFHTRFQFDERAKLSQSRDRTVDNSTGWVFLVDARPRIFQRVSIGERDLPIGRVDFLNLYFDLLPCFQHITGMRHSIPTHFADMHQAFGAPDIDESTKIHQLGHDSIERLPDGQGTQELLFLFLIFAF